MYIPKGAVEETDDYIPKGAIEETSQDDSSQSPGILETIGNALAPGIGSMTKVLAENPKSLVPAAKDLIKSVPRAAADTAANFADLASLGSPALTPMFDQAAQNVPTPSPEASNALEAAFNAIPAAKASELIPEIGKLGPAAIKSFSNFTGYNANSKATDFIKSLVGNQPQIKKTFQEGYKAIDSIADKNGYNLLPNKTKKPIEAEAFKTELAGLSNDDRTTLFNSLNAKKKALLDKFVDKPSYDNAHKLQSMFGRQGIKFLKNPETAPTGHEILNLRNLLNDDIHNTFQKYGDTDLLNARKEITDQYAQNQNRLLLAYKLKGGAKKFSDGISADASKVVNRYGNRAFEESLGRPGPKLTNSERDAVIDEMRTALARRSRTNWALGLAIPAGIIGEGLRRYLL